MTRILSVASEVAPLVKTGGLADVAGALPGAMAPLGWEMRTLLPGYPAVLDELAQWAELRPGVIDAETLALGAALAPRHLATAR